MVLLILFLANMSNYLDRGILAILQQPIKDDLRLADWQLGVISGPAFAACYALAGIPAARFADRGNRPRILTAAVAMWSATTALCGMATSFVFLVLCRVGVGIGEGVCTPTSHSLVASHFTVRQRGMAMALLTASIPLAQLIAPLMGGYVAALWGWRAAFIIAGLPGLLLAGAVLALLRETRSSAAASRAVPQHYWKGVKSLFAYRAYTMLWLASLFMGQALGATHAFSASYFMREHHMTLAQAGWVSAVSLGLAGLAGTFIGGFVADRFSGDFGRSQPYLCAAAAWLGGLFFAGTIFAAGWIAALMFLILSNMSISLKNGPNFAAAQNMAPEGMRATASAILMLGIHVIGGATGPLLLGLASDHLAAGHFAAHLGNYAGTCSGGPANQESVRLACAQASAAGLRQALFIPCVSLFLSGLFFFLSARLVDRPSEEACDAG
jgi:MFS family permease